MIVGLIPLDCDIAIPIQSLCYIREGLIQRQTESSIIPCLQVFIYCGFSVWIYATEPFFVERSHKVV